DRGSPHSSCERMKIIHVPPVGTVKLFHREIHTRREKQHIASAQTREVDKSESVHRKEVHDQTNEYQKPVYLRNAVSVIQNRSFPVFHSQRFWITIKKSMPLAASALRLIHFVSCHKIDQDKG